MYRYARDNKKAALAILHQVRDRLKPKGWNPKAPVKKVALYIEELNKDQNLVSVRHDWAVDVNP